MIIIVWNPREIWILHAKNKLFKHPFSKSIKILHFPKYTIQSRFLSKIWVKPFWVANPGPLFPPPPTPRNPDALSGRFAVAPTGLVDSTLNAAHRAAASVDVAPLGEYMCRRHMRTYRKRTLLRVNTAVPSFYMLHMLRMCSPRGNTQERKMDSHFRDCPSQELVFCYLWGDTPGSFVLCHRVP